jgi:hypothetical protein
VKGIGAAVAEYLSQKLEKFAKDPQDQDRGDHLVELCRSAEAIKWEMRKHPSKWDFGSWDGVQFPKVLANGVEVLKAAVN